MLNSMPESPARAVHGRAQLVLDVVGQIVHPPDHRNLMSLVSSVFSSERR
jgi:hypothetical protein